MTKQKERLIDKIAIYADFTGDPQNPEDLYAYFLETGKIYNAFALSEGKAVWSQEYANADEFLRGAQFVVLAHAVVTFLKHNTDVDPNSLGITKLAAELSKRTKQTASARYKRRHTGRSNRQTDQTVTDVLDEAYRALLSDEGRKGPPGRGPLLKKAKEIARRKRLGSKTANLITEHRARTYLQQKK